MSNSKLYFYYGTMNSGKSAHLIMQVYNLREQGYKVLTLKPSLDTRNFFTIKSRALQTELPVVHIDDTMDVFSFIESVMPDYVFIDEVNFLTSEQVEQLAKVVDNLDIPVFGYGLLVDYKSTLFEGSKRMIELADTIRELKSPCMKCRRKATMHLRQIDGKYVFQGESIQVGDIDTYMSVCRVCYNKAKNTNL